MHPTLDIIDYTALGSVIVALAGLLSWRIARAQKRSFVAPDVFGDVPFVHGEMRTAARKTRGDGAAAGSGPATHELSHQNNPSSHDGMEAA